MRELRPHALQPRLHLPFCHKPFCGRGVADVLFLGCVWGFHGCTLTVEGAVSFGATVRVIFVKSTVFVLCTSGSH